MEPTNKQTSTKESDDIIKPDVLNTKNKEDSKPITAIQNNFNFVQNVNLKDLTLLAQNNPKLAERYMELVEKNQEQTYILNMEALQLEKNEQKARLEEIPYLRKYTFRGQTFAFIISIVGLGTSIVFAFLDLSWQTIVAPITIPIGILAIKFLGGKSKEKDELETQTTTKPEKNKDI